MSPTEISPLYINPDDDRAAVEALIRKSEGRKLLLIFAGHTSSDIDIIDLQLLHRMAQRSEKQLAIATRNAKLIDAAEYLGIPRFRTPAQARRDDWKQTPSDINKKNESYIKIPTRFPIDGRKQPQHYRPFKHSRQWWEWTILGVTAVFIILTGFLLFSRATITIEPIPETQSLAMEAIASSAVRAAKLNGEIPLRSSSMILESTSSAEATGTLSFPEGYAEGILTITNLTDEEMTIPAGLLVQTMDVQPVQFVTNRAVKLGPAGEEVASTKVEITAKAPGRDGNVISGAIIAVSGEYGSSVSVSNTGATFGGYNRFVDTPANSDIDALRLALIADLLNQAKNEYATQMETDGLVLLEETIQVDEILSEEVVPLPGEPADEFHLTLRVRFTAQYIDPADLETVGIQLMDASMDPGYTSAEAGLHLSPANEPLLNEDGAYEWRVLLHRKVIPDLSELDLSSFRAQTKQQLVDWFSETYPTIENITIQLQPKLWWWLPMFPSRMEVITL